MDPIHYQYRFDFKDGSNEVFDIQLHPLTLNPMETVSDELPPWTRLEVHKCENCPLNEEESPHCPLAARLAPLVERMNHVVSIDDVDVTVILGDRTVTQSATAQEGISAMMGVITATSNCPHTIFFKPMARFHLPFASTEETLYRAASMYMLGQYYRWQNNLSADLDLDGLLRFYKEVEVVNKGIALRLRSEQREDGTVNAVVLLDMFAKSMQMSIKDVLDDLAPLFKPYLDQKRIDLGF